MFLNVLNLSFRNTAACSIFKSFCFSSKIYIFYSLTFFVSVIDKGFQARMRKSKRNNTVTKTESLFVDLCEFRFLCNIFFYTATAPYDTESMLFLFFNFFFSKSLREFILQAKLFEFHTWRSFFYSFMFFVRLFVLKILEIFFQINCENNLS